MMESIVIGGVTLIVVVLWLALDWVDRRRQRKIKRQKPQTAKPLIELCGRCGFMKKSGKCRCRHRR